MIKVQGLVKSFDGFTALNGAELHVERGSVYGLVGPNGAGKSTLLRCLAGVFKPDAGTILIDEQPIWGNTALKGRIAMIPDELFYFASSSTKDMAAFYEGIFPRFDRERYNKLREIFRTVNERAPIRRLSKGMQKQSAFWLAICCRPDVLILDEPVDGLDPVMRRQVWSILLGDVAEYGTTVLVSSHNLRELEDVCDHVGVMNQGRILLERSLSELQGAVTKLQIVFEEMPAQWPDAFPILHETTAGHMHTLILRGAPETIEETYRALGPIYAEAIPLTLEEIFIYELGGEDYAVRDILL